MSTSFKYNYKSIFGIYIEGLILQKKSCGFIYDYESYMLKRFDDFCINRNYTNSVITREIVMDWAIQTDSESINHRNQRVSFLRQLTLYMNSLGNNSYIPRRQSSQAITIPHIPDANELQELFDVIDNYQPKLKGWHVYTMIYQVLFRLYYCCGLRLAEGCNLKNTDVNLEKGILTIKQSKGKKDRLVYMADDLTALCKDYDVSISRIHADRAYFFPGRKPGKPLCKTGIDAKFKMFWEMTACSKNCEKAPTVHALRHAFVVDRINQWMSEGISLDIMMPYLCRYLGHSGIKDTMYYYHQVRTAFQIVRERDTVSSQVIPEVIMHES